MADALGRGAENTLPGRVRRYARVSGTMGGLAARLASARFLGIPIDKPQHAEELRLALGGLKGPLMKVAQLLATIPEALPKEYAAELAQLQSAAPPMGRPFVCCCMAAECGSDWESLVGAVRARGRRAPFGAVRSIAPSLMIGRRLARKLQVPGIESVVEADLIHLSLIFPIDRRDDRLDQSVVHRRGAA